MGPGKRSFVAGYAVTSKAWFGWFTRSPTKRLLGTLETRLRKIGFDHRAASPALVKLCLGHHQDVRLCAGLAAVTAVHRCVKRTQVPLRDWTSTGGPAKRVKSFLASLDWQQVAPWQWAHLGIRAALCSIPLWMLGLQKPIRWLTMSESLGDTGAGILCDLWPSRSADRSSRL